jgi:hypothetical protein
MIIGDFFFYLFPNKKLTPSSGDVSFIYAVVDHSSDTPFHDACCAGEVCFS